MRQLLLVEFGNVVAFLDKASLVGLVCGGESGDEGFVGGALGFQDGEAGGGCCG